jgi:hypothetical protein
VVPETIYASEYLDKLKEVEKAKVQYQEDLGNIIKQYEGRFKKMVSSTLIVMDMNDSNHTMRIMRSRSQLYIKTTRISWPSKKLSETMD